MKKLFFLLSVALCLFGCKSYGPVLPGISGKAGEVIIVMDKSLWEGALGEETRNLLASECPYLPQKEALFSLVNVTPSNLSDLFKIHRNIILFQVDPQIDTTGVIFKNNVWAQPQCAIQVSAYDTQGAIELLQKKGKTITRYLEQAELDRIMSNTLKYEEKETTLKVQEVFGGGPHFPTGYQIRKISDEFAWIAYDRQYVYQDVFIYRYPAEASHPFSSENIIRHRNEVLKNNVPGMRDNSYMITSEHFTPMIEYLKFRGRDIVQTRGMWEVENDFMGGPFVSHSFYSPDGKDIYVAEAWVYAPRYDKRQYLRQVESILHSWEWAQKEEN